MGPADQLASLANPATLRNSHEARMQAGSPDGRRRLSSRFCLRSPRKIGSKWVACRPFYKKHNTNRKDYKSTPVGPTPRTSCAASTHAIDLLSFEVLMLARCMSHESNSNTEPALTDGVTARPSSSSMPSTVRYCPFQTPCEKTSSTQSRKHTTFQN